MFPTTPIPVIHSRWQHTFHVSFSAMEFYSLVEDKLKSLEIPDVKISRVNFSQGGMLSAKREYLRVKRKEYIFDICAAPFAETFFVSYWFGETSGWLRELIAKIPIIGPPLAKASEMKTYYQWDSINMFSGAVKSAVNEAIDDMTKAKGVRGLSDVERASENITKQH
jgi:hypothetical protein